MERSWPPRRLARWTARCAIRRTSLHPVDHLGVPALTPPRRSCLLRPCPSPQPSLPNLLTIGRIVAIPVICLLLVIGWHWLRWIALLLYIAAAVTDWLDGYLARRLNQGSAARQHARSHRRQAARRRPARRPRLDTATLDGWDLIPAIAIMHARDLRLRPPRIPRQPRNVVVPRHALAKWKTTVAARRARPSSSLDRARPRPRPRQPTSSSGSPASSPSGPARSIFARRLAAPLGSAEMKILYFAWLRERLNRGEEEVDPARRGRDRRRPHSVAAQPRRSR